MRVDIETYVNQLTGEFQQVANSAIAEQQKDYMKGLFEFYGMKTPQRREVQKPFLEKQFLPEKNQLPGLMKALWEKPQRDFQMFGLDLAFKYKRGLEVEDIEWIENMITTRSWWDSVDLTATHMVGSCFMKYPERRNEQIEVWMKSENIWLQRTCLIFQLKYKEKLDAELLENLIMQLLGSDEFFINKAIGWALREHSKLDPKWVVDFVNKTELSNLSKREALRLIDQ